MEVRKEINDMIYYNIPEPPKITRNQNICLKCYSHIIADTKTFNIMMLRHFQNIPFYPFYHRSRSHLPTL